MRSIIGLIKDRYVIKDRWNSFGVQILSRIWPESAIVPEEYK